MILYNSKIIFFATLITAIIISFNSMNIAQADSEEHVTIRSAIPDEITILSEPREFQDKNENLYPMKLTEQQRQIQELIESNPIQFTFEENEIFKQQSLENNEVKIMLGENAKYDATAFYFDGEKWQPEVTFMTGDEKEKVTVTLKNGKVINIQKYSQEKYSHSEAGFGIELANNPATMNGNLMALNVPEYAHNGNVPGEPNWTALLLNSMKYNSTFNMLCESIYFPDQYWMQIGLNFDDQGIRLGYTDTSLDCGRNFLSMPINTDDRLDFFTIVEDSTDKWTLYAVNYDIPPPNVFGYFKIVPNSSLIANSYTDVGTNVFFENQNSASIGWSLGFIDDPLVDYAGFRNPSDSLWYFWQDDVEATGGCHPGPITTDDLTDGSFTSPSRDVTIDTSNMDTLCGQN